MKIKTVLITLAVTGGLLGGAGYGAYYALQTGVKPVSVVPIQNINWGYFGDDSTMSGTIISMDSQKVELENGYDLVKVYVQAGDMVKVGDPLLEYDMTMAELRLEMEQLTKQGLELSQKVLEKEVQKWKNITPGAAVSLDEDDYTASADMIEEVIPDGGDGSLIGGGETDPSTVPDGEISEGNAPGGDFSGGDIWDGETSGGETSGGESSSGETSGGESYGGETSGGESYGGEISGGDDTGTVPVTPDDIIEGSDEDTSDEETVIPSDEDNQGSDSALIIDEGDEGADSPVISDDENGDHSQNLVVDEETDEFREVDLKAEEVMKYVNEFLARVNQLSVQELDKLLWTDIEESLRIYRDYLAAEPKSRDIVDMIGEVRTQYAYSLKGSVAAVVGEDYAPILAQAYDRVCVYQLIYLMQQLNPDGLSVKELKDLTKEELLLREPQLLAALEAYYGLQAAALKDYEENLKPYIEALKAISGRMKESSIIDDPDPDMTEFETDDWDDGDWDDGDWGDYGDDGMSYTREELDAYIKEAELELSENKLQIREQDLKIRQDQRVVDNKIVKATMDGVVTYAGTVKDTVSDDGFIVISGSEGMYVQGTLDELKLDTIHVGDQISGTSYENGMNFVATITEISTYPSANTDSFYYGYGQNPNSSSYPFLAYIEDSSDLEEGDVEMQIVNLEPSTGIYIEKFYVREEVDGTEYCYIQGSDGLLKKQKVVTGITIYGSAVEIKTGLTVNDKIAFPYGKNVVEGAQTKEVDSIDTGYYMY